MFKQFAKVFAAIFKGPASRGNGRAKRSTSQSRYSSRTPAISRSRLKERTTVPRKAKRRSAKSYLKRGQRPSLKAGKSRPAVQPAKKTLKSIKSPASVKKGAVPLKKEFFVGEITHYFSKISVVVVKVIDHPLLIGDQIRIKGSTVDFSQKVDSLQVESKDVRFGRRGELVGLKVTQAAKPGDKIYKLKK